LTRFSNVLVIAEFYQGKMLNLFFPLAISCVHRHIFSAIIDNNRWADSDFNMYNT